MSVLLSERDQEFPELYYLHSSILHAATGRTIIHVSTVPTWKSMCEHLSRIPGVTDVKLQGTKLSFVLRGCKCIASYGCTNRSWDQESSSYLSGTIITLKGEEGSDDFDWAMHEVRCVCNRATRNFLGD